MSESLEIHSHRGVYSVVFSNSPLSSIETLSRGDIHCIVDRRVAELHGESLYPLLDQSSTLLLDAVEETKSLEQFPKYIQHFVSHSIRRGSMLVAVGGGIVQDVTSFLAATMLRGLDWTFFPTTLLAQADSCIGSKSSINCAGVKNILGTFTPPQKVFIANSFLRTLENKEIRSGVGEMLKVHAIKGRDCLRRFSKDYDDLLIDHALMSKAIWNSLKIKKRYVEKDEFDKGDRLVFNYGHSFGHAIEAATNYAVPHGIAVSMGCDMANFVAMKMDLAPTSYWREMSPIYRKNYCSFSNVNIPFDKFLVALAKDKKNVGSELRLILCKDYGDVFKASVKNDLKLKNWISEYFENEL